MPEYIVIRSSKQPTAKLPYDYALKADMPLWNRVDSSVTVDNSWTCFHLDSDVARLNSSILRSNHKEHYVSSIFSESPYVGTLDTPKRIYKDVTGTTILNIWLVFILGMLTFIRVRRLTQATQWIKSAFRLSGLMRFMDEYQPGMRPPFFSAYLFSVLIISGSFFAFLSSVMGFPDNWTIYMALACIFVVFALPYIHNIIIVIWGWIFDEAAIAKVHVQISYLGLMGYALYLVPFFLNKVMRFGADEFFNQYYLLAGIGVLMLYQAIKIFTAGKSKGILSVVYIFLYFCTLEVIPLLLIAILISKH